MTEEYFCYPLFNEDNLYHLYLTNLAYETFPRVAVLSQYCLPFANSFFSLQSSLLGRPPLLSNADTALGHSSCAQSA